MAADWAKVRRWLATSRTWSEKSSVLLEWEGKNAASAEHQWLAGYEAERSLYAMLGDAGRLVSLLQEDQIEAVERRAKKLASMLRAHRLAGTLSNIEGRTPEEAEAFLRKANDLQDVSAEVDC